MNKERDKYLTEAQGECWHEFGRVSKDSVGICRKCNILEWHPDSSIPQAGEENDFSTWDGFGKLKEFMEVQPYWDKFVNWVLITYFIGNDVVTKMTLLFSKERFADICYKFLRENPLHES